MLELIRHYDICTRSDYVCSAYVQVLFAIGNTLEVEILNKSVFAQNFSKLPLHYRNLFLKLEGAGEGSRLAILTLQVRVWQ